MPALTGIRLPLALWVVVHHISGRGGMLEPLVGANPIARDVVDAAWVALTIFFAISGFVLARSYRAQCWTPAGLRRYAVARFGRIYPLYALSLVMLLPIIVDTLRNDGLGGAAGAGLLLNHVLLLQAWHWPSVNWNTPAWSLSSEVFFYALAPVVVRLVRVASWPRVMAAAAIACAVPLLMRVAIEPPVPKALLYLGDFLIGVAAAGLYVRLQERKSPSGAWLSGLACVLGATLFVIRDALGHFMILDTGLRLASGLLVAGIACGGGTLVRVLSSRLVLAGGRASYAIYILHIPVLWYYRRWGYDTVDSPLLAAAVYVAVVVALALVISRWYERPADVLIGRWYSSTAAGTAPTLPAGTDQRRTPGLKPARGYPRLRLRAAIQPTRPD